MRMPCCLWEAAGQQGGGCWQGAASGVLQDCTGVLGSPGRPWGGWGKEQRAEAGGGPEGEAEGGWREQGRVSHCEGRLRAARPLPCMTGSGLGVSLIAGAALPHGGLALSLTPPPRPLQGASPPQAPPSCLGHFEAQAAQILQFLGVFLDDFFRNFFAVSFSLFLLGGGISIN